MKPDTMLLVFYSDNGTGIGSDILFELISTI